MFQNKAFLKTLYNDKTKLKKKWRKIDSGLSSYRLIIFFNNTFFHLHVRWRPKKWVSTCTFFYFKKKFSELDCNICYKVIAYKICRLQMMGKTHLFTYIQFLWICLLSDMLVKKFRVIIKMCIFLTKLTRYWMDRW